MDVGNRKASFGAQTVVRYRLLVMTTTGTPVLIEIYQPRINRAAKVLEFTIGGSVIGFSGIKVWVNEGVQAKCYQYPWDEVTPAHRPGGDKYSSVMTVNGVQFFKVDGTLVWFPYQNIVRVEAYSVR